MELQQQLVEDIEKLISSSTTIRQSCCNLLTYLKEPKTKLELTEYLKLNIIDKMFENKNFSKIYVSMVPQKSHYNTRMVMMSLKYDELTSKFILGENYALQYRQVIEKVMELMSQIGDQVKEMTYDDVVERGIALRRSYVRLKVICHEDLPVAIAEDQMHEIDISGYDDSGDYMTKTIEELENEVRESYRIDEVKKLFGWDHHPQATCSREVNLRSLLNFVVYLGSIVRY